MGFLDKISESISETGQGIKRMADQTSAKSQMNSDIKKKEKEMEDLVYQIGFRMISNEPDLCEEKCPELYSKLVETREAVRELRTKLSMAELEITCPGCGRTVKGVSKFCTFCGTLLPEPDLNAAGGYEKPNNDEGKNNLSGEMCPGCGAPLKVGAAFCVNCGRPVNSAEEATLQATSETAGPAVCKKCGAELQEDDAFCTMCGTPV